MSAYRSARVYVQGICAGELRETENGYMFSYEEEYVRKQLPAVSLTLPAEVAAQENSSKEKTPLPAGARMFFEAFPAGKQKCSKKATGPRSIAAGLFLQ